MTDGRTDGLVRLVSMLGGAAFVGFGLWAFVAPRSFFDVLATFEPFNLHVVRDIGAFQLGLGAVLLLSLRALPTATVALGGVGIGAAAHAVGHVVDRGLGGSPATDIPTFTLLAVALLAGAWRAHRDESIPRPHRRTMTTRTEQP